MNPIVWRYIDNRAKNEIIRLKERNRELEAALAEEIDGQNMALEKLCRVTDELVQARQYAELLRKQVEAMEKTNEHTRYGR